MSLTASDQWLSFIEDIRQVLMTKPKRKIGRPANDDERNLSGDSILSFTLDMARQIPLQDISIAAVARALEITPAVIHYYLGNRNYLISGAMNLFYRYLLDRWPEPKGDWRLDLRNASIHIYHAFVAYRGVAAYVASNSRFRVFQLTPDDSPDYGVLLLERFTGLVREAGLNGERTGVYAHLIIETIITTSHGTARHLFPGEHKRFLNEKLKALASDDFPNIHFARQSPLKMDGKVALNEALDLYLLGIEREKKPAKG